MDDTRRFLIRNRLKHMTRRQMLRLSLGGATALRALRSVPAAIAAGPDAATGKRGGILQIATNRFSPVDTLDPAKGTTDGPALVQAILRETLTILDDNLRPVPLLAERYEANSDFTEWTFYLRPNVVFHSGQPLTTEDVAWTLTRNLDKVTGSKAYGRLAQTMDPAGIQIVNATTIKLKLKSSDSNLPITLARHHLSICPKGTTDFTRGMGSGPFRMTAFNAGVSLEAVRNDQYWMPGLPLLDGIRIIQIAESSTKTQSVISGATDLTEIDYQSLPLVRSNSTVQLTAARNSHLLDVVMSEDIAPFTDVRVRQAVKLAVDREHIVKVAYAGHGSVAADIPMPADDPAFPIALKVRMKRDIQAAQELLAEAGFATGLDLVLKAPSTTLHSTFALAFADALKGSPFRVKVEQHPAETYDDQIFMHSDFYVSDWNRASPLEALANEFLSTSAINETHTKNPELDGLISKGFVATGAAQDKIIEQAMLLVANNSGSVIPAYRDRLYLTKERVKNLKPATSVLLDLRRTSIG